jgi:outer membrane protein assembly factor BamE (lipoprotein component of BamABCDE complex)
MAVGCVLMFSCWDGTYKPVTGRAFDYEKARAIPIGASRDSVVTALGTPTAVTRLVSGEEQWQYLCVLERKAGFDFGVRVPTATHRRKRQAVFRIRNGHVDGRSVTDELL